MREKEPIIAPLPIVSPPRSFSSAPWRMVTPSPIDEVVAVGQIDAVKDLYARAQMLKDVPAQHAAETQSQPVVQPDGRAVEHLPEPEQRFALGVALPVHVGVVLRLQRHVCRIERKRQRSAWQLRGKVHGRLARVRTAQIKLVKLVAHNLGAALGRAVANQFVVKKLQPAAIKLFRFLGRMRSLIAKPAFAFPYAAQYTKTPVRIELARIAFAALPPSLNGP